MRPHWQRRGVTLAGRRAWPQSNTLKEHPSLFGAVLSPSVPHATRAQSQTANKGRRSERFARGPLRKPAAPATQRGSPAGTTADGPAYNALRYSSGPCRRGRGCPRRRWGLGWEQRGSDCGRKSFAGQVRVMGLSLSLLLLCVPRTRRPRPCASALISRTTTATGSSTAPIPTAQPAPQLKPK